MGCGFGGPDLLWGSAMGQGYGDLLWGRAIGQCYGAGLWGRAIGQRYGAALWGRAIGQGYRAALWGSAVPAPPVSMATADAENNHVVEGGGGGGGGWGAPHRIRPISGTHRWDPQTSPPPPPTHTVGFCSRLWGGGDVIGTVNGALFCGAAAPGTGGGGGGGGLPHKCPISAPWVPHCCPISPLLLCPTAAP